MANQGRAHHLRRPMAERHQHANETQPNSNDCPPPKPSRSKNLPPVADRKVPAVPQRSPTVLQQPADESVYEEPDEIRAKPDTKFNTPKPSKNEDVLRVPENPSLDIGDGYEKMDGSNSASKKPSPNAKKFNGFKSPLSFAQNIKERLASTFNLTSSSQRQQQSLDQMSDNTLSVSSHDSFSSDDEDDLNYVKPDDALNDRNPQPKKNKNTSPSSLAVTKPSMPSSLKDADGYDIPLDSDEDSPPSHPPPPVRTKHHQQQQPTQHPASKLNTPAFFPNENAHLTPKNVNGGGGPLFGQAAQNRNPNRNRGNGSPAAKSSHTNKPSAIQQSYHDVPPPRQPAPTPNKTNLNPPGKKVSSMVQELATSFQVRQTLTKPALPSSTPSDNRQNNSSTPSPHSPEVDRLEMQPWFFSHSNKDILNKKLLDMKMDGAFLVRRSERGGAKQPYTLCITYEGDLFNIQIRRREDNQFALGTEKPNEQAYENVSNIVEFHHSNELEVTKHGRLQAHVRLITSPAK